MQGPRAAQLAAQPQLLAAQPLAAMRHARLVEGAGTCLLIPHAVHPSGLGVQPPPHICGTRGGGWPETSTCGSVQQKQLQKERMQGPAAAIPAPPRLGTGSCLCLLPRTWVAGGQGMQDCQLLLAVDVSKGPQGGVHIPRLCRHIEVPHNQHLVDSNAALMWGLRGEDEGQFGQRGMLRVVPVAIHTRTHTHVQHLAVISHIGSTSPGRQPALAPPGPGQPARHTFSSVPPGSAACTAGGGGRAGRRHWARRHSPGQSGSGL